MIKKVEGIVVSEIDYKETSKIINVLTKEDGIIGVLAHGSKKLKSNVKASKLSYGYFHINYKEKGLSTLIEVDIIDNFKNIKKDIKKISYALFLLELSYDVYKHGQNMVIYKILISALLKIEEGFDEELITYIVELKYLEYLGIKPEVDGCVSCGKTDIITISSYKGGYLCPSCLGNEKIFLDKTIKLIRMLYYVDIGKISKLEISSKVKKELEEFINDYYDRYSGLYLKSKKILTELSKL